MKNMRLMLPLKQAFVLLAFLCGAGVLSYYWFDKPVAEFAHAYPWGSLKYSLSGMSMLGLGSLLFTLAIGGAVVSRWVIRHPIWEARCWLLFWALVLETITCLPLKMTLGRARPVLWLEQGLYGFFGFSTDSTFWSFPSGHTAVSMTFAFCVVWLCPRFRVPALLYASMVALSRILLYRHFVSDIMAGTGLALIVVLSYTYFLQSVGWLKLAWQASPKPSDDTQVERVCQRK